MKKALALAATLAIAPLSWAETLTIPMEFEFVAVDGTDQRSTRSTAQAACSTS